MFRSESRQVIVDAIAMDGKGNYVRNLSPQDFRLWEDGKEQAIQSVIRVSTPGSSPAKQKQYIVLYFERMSFEDQIQLRDAAIRFAETSAGPDRVMAVLQHDGYGLTRLVQEFTDDAAELRRAIGKARASAIPTERNGETRVISLSQNRARMYDLMRLLKSLSTIPGRKALVLFSPDRSPSPQSVEESSVRELIDSANKANTAVYPISSMGWMDRVAKETGGLMTISAYASEALQKVASEQNEYYRISYVPAKSAENSCHAIRLAVSRPGVRLRARSQYCNLRPADPLAGTELDRQMVAAAASSTAGATKTPAQVTFFYTKAGTARVHVAAEVPPAVVKFDKQEGKVRSRVNVLGIACRKDGSVGARFSDELDYVFDQRDKAEAFLKQPIGYQAQMEVVPGEYLIKLVFGSDRGAPATLQASLGIEAYDSKVSRSAAWHSVKKCVTLQALLRMLTRSLPPTARHSSAKVWSSFQPQTTFCGGPTTPASTSKSTILRWNSRALLLSTWNCES